MNEREMTRFSEAFDAGLKTITVSHKACAQWNAGERDSGTTRTLYLVNMVEPYITWASELSWRVTDAGKKAGLK